MRRLSVLGVALALGLAATTTARADGARKTVLPSPQRKLGAPTSARIRVYSLPATRRSPVSFKPFQVRNPRTGRPLSPQAVLTLRSGRKIKAGAYVARLNRIEQRLNVRGYTLRNNRPPRRLLPDSRGSRQRLVGLVRNAPSRIAALGGPQRQQGSPLGPQSQSGTSPAPSPSGNAGQDGRQGPADALAGAADAGARDAAPDSAAGDDFVTNLALDINPDDEGPLPPDLQGVLNDLNDAVNGLGDTFSQDAKQALDDLPPSSPLDDLTTPSSDGTPFELPPGAIDYTEDDLSNDVLGSTLDQPDRPEDPDKPDTSGSYPNPDGNDPVGPAGPLAYPTPDGPPGGPVGIVTGAMAGALSLRP